MWAVIRERLRALVSPAQVARLALASCVLLVAWLPVQAPGPDPLALGGQAQVAALPSVASAAWLYLRDGQPPAPGETLVEVLAVGDVMPGRGVAASIGQEDPLAGVALWLRAADLALGNLECVLGDAGQPRPGPYRLHAPAAAASMLARAGFDVLGLANNHALDYGPEALAGTAALLGQAGVDVVGAGPGPEAATRPVVRHVRGLRLAFLAFNAVPDPDGPPAGDAWTPAPWDLGSAAAAVAAARAEADAVIVSVHWGYEYERRADPAQRAMARTLLAAGADLVVGHHPHVVQETATAAELEVAAGQGFVAYSLGNLLFDQEQGETRHGLVLRAFFDGDGLRAVQGLPVQAGPRPHPPGPIRPDGSPLLRGEGGEGSPLPDQEGSAASVQLPSPPAGRGANGPDRAGGEGAKLRSEIDLTGDGVPEEVRLEGEQVVVYEAGAETWRGLPEWRVVDLALGDPNDDGRSEMVLALWKEDAEGVPRCHPFMVGYRGGNYRVLWGGSALPRPIHEVELGDVDGDGVQELLVLEEQDNGERKVAAWRWHGWGFSLLWRSAPGPYQNLALLPGIDGAPPRVTVERAP